MTNSSLYSFDDAVASDNFTEIFERPEEIYIFHELRVKIPLLLLYSTVFVLAFFGNLLVVLVMTLHRRMRSHTNFFLTNLAVADLCVSVFCVFQNFAMYVIQDWYLGQFLCQMYHFVTSLSCTASVIILVVVSGERYLAIVEPLKAKSLLTRKNMMITMALVWVFSALYSCPRLYFFEVAEYPVGNRTEAMCILRRDQFDTKSWDVVSLILLFLLPLLLLTVLYLKIVKVLCASSKLLAQVSYYETGKFIRTSSNSCYSASTRHCNCSTTRQDNITTTTALNNRLLPSKISNLCTTVDEPCGADLNNGSYDCQQKLILSTPKKKRKTQIGRFFKKLPECDHHHHLVRKCSKPFHIDDRHSAESSFPDVIYQGNSGSYESDPDDHVSATVRGSQPCLPMQVNDENIEFIPLTIRNSTQSLHCPSCNSNTPCNASACRKSLNNLPSIEHDRCSQDYYKSDVNSRESTRNQPSSRLCSNNQELRHDSSRPNTAKPPKTIKLKDSSRKKATVVMRPSPVVLNARRKVVHMLVLVVVSFAVFSLPFHTRKMLQYFFPQYDHTSSFSLLLTPITCLLMFAHSAVNPILYTCLSRKFRTSLKDLISCKMSSRRATKHSCRAKPVMAKLKKDGKVELQLN